MSNMVVNTNVLALNSHRNLKGVGTTQARSSARLSSGMKINSAADDAAGLAISEKMRAQIRGLDMASKNSQDAISLIQTAEGGMQEIDNMLQRIRELTVQVSNDTNEHNAEKTGDRQKMQDEVNQLVEEIDSMANRVEFNKKKVINGDYSNASSDVSRIKGDMSVANSALKKVTGLHSDAIEAESLATAAVTAASKAYLKYADTAAAAPGNLAQAAADFDNGTVTAATSDGTTLLVDAWATVAAGAVASTGTSAADRLVALQSDVVVDIGLATAAANTVDLKGALVGTDDKKFGDMLINMDTGTPATTAGNTKVAFQNMFSAVALAAATTAAGAEGMNMLEMFSGSTTAWTSNIPTQAQHDAAKANLANVRKIAAYDTSNSSAAVKEYVKLASDALKSYDKALASVADGGEFNTAKKTYETYLKREEEMAQTFTDNVTKLGVATSVKDNAKAGVDNEQSKVDGLSTQLDAAEQAALASGKNDGLHFQVGANSSQSLQMNIGSAKTDTLGIGDGKGKTNIDFLKDSGVDTTEILDRLDTALSYITSERSKLGASQNRLEYTIKSLDISSENLSASESRIRDTDMAKEMMNKTKSDVLSQAATAMLAKGNQAPQAVLQLLQ